MYRLQFPTLTGFEGDYLKLNQHVVATAFALKAFWLMTVLRFIFRSYWKMSISITTLIVSNCHQLIYATEDCVDRNRYCQHWASQGHCYANPGYMGPNCKRSCGICSRWVGLIKYFCCIVLIRNLGSNEALNIPSIGNSVDYNCLFCANSSTLIYKRICFKNINNEVKW